MNACNRHAWQLFYRHISMAAVSLVAWCGAAQAQDVILSTPTTVRLTSTSKSIEAGVSVMLSAHVATDAGAGVPGGTVQFIDETTMAVLGWANASSPVITVSGLSIGEHRIRADYSGTADFLPAMIQPSRSALLVETVREAVDVKISSSENPSTPGQLVTLTATVTSRDGPPKGAITFSDGHHVLAAHVELDQGGTASFTTSALDDGPRTIVARYEGNRVHAAAVSPGLDQDVGMTRIRSSMLAPTR